MACAFLILSRPFPKWRGIALVFTAAYRPALRRTPEGQAAQGGGINRLGFVPVFFAHGFVVHGAFFIYLFSKYICNVRGVH